MKWRSLEESVATEQTSLRDIYAERKALIEKYVRADVRAVHARVIEELKESGIAERALRPGDAAPDFELPDQNGNLVRSRGLAASRRQIIFFVRGRWCPFCVGQVEAMNAIEPDLQALGASVLAISPQTIHQNFLMADQHKLRFPLLSDAGNKVARQFGLVYRVPEYQQEIYSRALVNLPFINGDSSWELPIPATYVIDKHLPTTGSETKILYSSANPDYTSRPEPLGLLHFLHSQTFN